MITSPSPPQSFSTPSRSNLISHSNQRAADLESQARLVEEVITKLKDENNRQFYRQVVQSYRAVAREILRKALLADRHKLG